MEGRGFRRAEQASFKNRHPEEALSVCVKLDFSDHGGT
jgi:hypothetical protein